MLKVRSSLIFQRGTSTDTITGAALAPVVLQGDVVRYDRNVALTVMFSTAPSARETGQFSFAPLASS